MSEPIQSRPNGPSARLRTVGRGARWLAVVGSLVLVAGLPATSAGAAPARDAGGYDPASRAIGFTALTLTAYPGMIANTGTPAETPCHALDAIRIDYDWGENSPGGTCGSDDFSVHGTGTIVAPYTGTVEFCTSNDDGMYVEIGDPAADGLRIGDWGYHGPTEPCDNTGSMSMVQGTAYSFATWYFEAGGGAVMRFRWRYAGGSWTTVPGLPSTVTVTPGGAVPGRVQAADGSIDCTWDGSASSGTCSTTTPFPLLLFATTTDATDMWLWSGACAGSATECTPALSSASVAVGITFSEPFGFTALALAAYDESASDDETGSGSGMPEVVVYPNAPTGASCATLSAARLDFDWGETGSPGGTCPGDWFSVYGTGTLVPPPGATAIEFCTSNDDGMYVHIGDPASPFVLGDWGRHGAYEPCNNTGTMTVTPGTSYPVTAWFFDAVEGAVMRLRWRIDGGDWAPVPGLPSTVTVTPGGSVPGRVFSFDGQINCFWDGTATAGDCTSTTAAAFTLLATEDGAPVDVVWADDCADAIGARCTPSFSETATTVGITFVPPCGVVGNLVDNCGFETGDFTSWDRGGTAQVNDIDQADGIVRSGTRSAGLASWDGTSTLEQTISVTQGDQYRLSFHLRHPQSLPPQAEARLEAAVTNGSGTALAASVEAQLADWTEYAFLFTAAAPAVTISFTGIEPDNSWLLDDVSLVDVGSGAVDYALTVATPVDGTITTGDGNVDCGTDCTHLYASGSPVTLTATPASGYTFGGWSGACAGTSGTSCTVDVYSALTVGARFGRLLTVTSPTGGRITSDDGRIDCGQGETTCSAVLTGGSQITLYAIRDLNHSLTAWTGCTPAILNPPSIECTVTMSGDVTLAASFTPWYSVAVTGPNARGKYALTVTWSIPATEGLRVTYIEIRNSGGVAVLTKGTLSTSGSWSKTISFGTGSVRIYANGGSKRGLAAGQQANIPFP